MLNSEKKKKRQIRIDNIVLKMRVLSRFPNRLGSSESDLIFVLNELARAENVLGELMELKEQLPDNAKGILMKWYGMEGYVE